MLKEIVELILLSDILKQFIIYDLSDIEIEIRKNERYEDNTEDEIYKGDFKGLITFLKQKGGNNE